MVLPKPFFLIYTMLCVVDKGDLQRCGDARVDWFVFWRCVLTRGRWSSGYRDAEEINPETTQGGRAFEAAIVLVNNVLLAKHTPLYLQTEIIKRRLSAPLCRILWWNFNQHPEDVLIRRERCHKNICSVSRWTIPVDFKGFSSDMLSPLVGHRITEAAPLYSSPWGVTAGWSVSAGPRRKLHWAWDR